MPQGSSASPGWFVRVINEVIKDLKQVAAYLVDVSVFDSDPVAHVRSIISLFERLRSIASSFLPRRRDWVPPIRTFWATPFPRQVYVQTQKKCRH